MTPLAPGKTISHYRIIEQLGQGGQATAYKAEDTRLNRLVVLKTLLPELAVLELSTKKINQVAEFKKPKPLREVSIVYARSVSKKKFIDVLKKQIIKNMPEELLNKKRGAVVEWK